MFAKQISEESEVYILIILEIHFQPLSSEHVSLKPWYLKSTLTALLHLIITTDHLIVTKARVLPMFRKTET